MMRSRGISKHVKNDAVTDVSAIRVSSARAGSALAVQKPGRRQRVRCEQRDKITTTPVILFVSMSQWLRVALTYLGLQECFPSLISRMQNIAKSAINDFLAPYFLHVCGGMRLGIVEPNLFAAAVQRQRRIAAYANDLKKRAAETFDMVLMERIRVVIAVESTFIFELSSQVAGLVRGAYHGAQGWRGELQAALHDYRPYYRSCVLSVCRRFDGKAEQLNGTHGEATNEDDVFDPSTLSTITRVLGTDVNGYHEATKEELIERIACIFDVCPEALDRFYQARAHPRTEPNQAYLFCVEAEQLFQERKNNLLTVGYSPVLITVFQYLAGLFGLFVILSGNLTWRYVFLKNIIDVIRDALIALHKASVVESIGVIADLAIQIVWQLSYGEFKARFVSWCWAVLTITVLLASALWWRPWVQKFQLAQKVCAVLVDPYAQTFAIAMSVLGIFVGGLGGGKQQVKKGPKRSAAAAVSLLEEELERAEGAADAASEVEETPEAMEKRLIAEQVKRQLPGFRDRKGVFFTAPDDMMKPYPVQYDMVSRQDPTFADIAFGNELPKWESKRREISLLFLLPGLVEACFIISMLLTVLAVKHRFLRMRGVKIFIDSVIDRIAPSFFDYDMYRSFVHDPLPKHVYADKDLRKVAWQNCDIFEWSTVLKDVPKEPKIVNPDFRNPGYARQDRSHEAYMIELTVNKIMIRNGADPISAPMFIGMCDQVTADHCCVRTAEFDAHAALKRMQLICNSQHSGNVKPHSEDGEAYTILFVCEIMTKQSNSFVWSIRNSLNRLPGS